MLDTKLTSLLALAFGALLATQASAQTVLSCPFSNAGADNSSRGFYVTSYPASTLGTVTLNMIPFSAGAVTDTLTARSGAFNGPVLGTATLSFVAGGTSQLLVFNFGNVPVTPGSTITFAHSISGVGVPDWDTGMGPCPNVFETDGTTPPLDTVRGTSYGLQIANAVGAPPIPTPTLSALQLFMLMGALAALAVVVLRWRR